VNKVHEHTHTHTHTHIIPVRVRLLSNFWMCLCVFSAFLAKHLSIFYRVVNVVSILLYGILLYGVHKVSTVESWWEFAKNECYGCILSST